MRGKGEGESKWWVLYVSVVHFFFGSSLLFCFFLSLCVSRKAAGCQIKLISPLTLTHHTHKLSRSFAFTPFAFPHITCNLTRSLKYFRHCACLALLSYLFRLFSCFFSSHSFCISPFFLLCPPFSYSASFALFYFFFLLFVFKHPPAS